MTSEDNVEVSIGKPVNSISYTIVAFQQHHCLCSRWHHSVNEKAGGNSIGFYRLVALLQSEADLVTIAVETGALPLLKPSLDPATGCTGSAVAEVCGWFENVQIPAARRRVVCH